MKTSYTLIVGVSFVLLFGVAITAISEESSSTNSDYIVFNQVYTELLEAYVNDSGMVKYSELKKDNGRLERAYNELAKIQKTAYDQWSDREKIAFYVNVYNFLTLKVIVDNYPIKSSFFSSLRFPKNSIRQISGVWDIIQFSVMGEMVTLDHIEHEILRAQFNEPRIHMSLVCAAMGCPSLRNEPYNADTLDRQFEDQTRRFLFNPLKFSIDRDSKNVYVSPIFKWFGEDFVALYGDSDIPGGFSDSESAVLKFMAQHAGKAAHDFLLTGSYKIVYLDYDWELNEQK